MPRGMAMLRYCSLVMWAALDGSPDHRLGNTAEDAPGNTSSLGLPLRSGGHFLFMLHSLLCRPLLWSVEEHITAIANPPDHAEDKEEPDKSAVVTRCK